MAVTESHLALLNAGCTDWRFEGQLRNSFFWGGKRWEVRPDGMVRRDGLMTLLEIDMGHGDPGKYRLKLKSYQGFVESGELARTWGESEIAVLTLTTGKLRRTRLARISPPSSDSICFNYQTFDDLGIQIAGGWS